MRFVRSSSPGLWLLLLFVSTAGADGVLPDPRYSLYWREYAGGEVVACVVHPDGQGGRLDEARTQDLNQGIVVDSTIYVRLLDPALNPLVDFPREDMWLESLDPNFVTCQDGSLADTNTDQNGESTWVLPLKAGGYSEDYTQVVVIGMPIESNVGLAVHFNSPDINGDLEVDLSDVAIFAGDYYGGTYQFRSDLYFDGVLNLSDLGKFMEGFGAACP